MSRIIGILAVLVFCGIIFCTDKVRERLAVRNDYQQKIDSLAAKIGEKDSVIQRLQQDREINLVNGRRP